MTLPPDVGIKDNRYCGTVGDFLRPRILPGASLSFVSAYFSIYAYDALRTELDRIGNLRFLFGEPRFLKSLDPARSETKHFAIDGTGLSLSNILSQKAAARACERWIESKVEVRSITQAGLLHGKMYIVDGEHTDPPHTNQREVATLFGDTPVNLSLYEHNESLRRTAIVGSSNFTMRGLGLAQSGNNIEINLNVRDPEDFDALAQWFEQIWNDKGLTEDVKEEVLLYLRQLYENRAPEFVYYKTLFHVFERLWREISEGGFDVQTRKLTETAVWNALYDFQKDGVKGAIRKIEEQNGCILADSVGLGKTWEALAVIKHYEMQNANVLVLCPKKLEENWTVYQAASRDNRNPFAADRFGFAVLAHTDLNRSRGMAGPINLENFNWHAFDLIVIDESHNFRTESRGKEGRKTRYECLVEDVVQAGGKTKVLLLSATPVNNDLKDLRAQIRLIVEGQPQSDRDRSLEEINSLLQVAQKRFNKWAEERHGDRTIGAGKLLETLSANFFTLLDDITIARSRRHIVKYYPDEMKRIGTFPAREKPVTLTPAVDSEGGFPSYNEVYDKINGYTLALFRPTAYVKAEFKDSYNDEKVKNFSQAMRENYLVGMMRVNFLKRLESGVHSFAATLERTIFRIEERERALREAREKASISSAETLDAADDAEDIIGEDEEFDALAVGALKIPFSHLDIPRYLRDLESDRRKLKNLADSARAVTVSRDAKLQELKCIIREKAEKPNRKVLVFTAFADTARYLYDALHRWANDELGIESALVVGSGVNAATLGRPDFQDILTNFSPIAKKRAGFGGQSSEGEIDLLIATDCISEGQNLQDADMVVNYDIHWNPVRLIQRFGRIDRLGSKNPSITMVNFWPTDDLDRYVNLKNRVEARMALVDMTATGYDNLLAAHDGTEKIDIEDLIEGDLHYRDQQLLRLKKEVLDLEDMTETVDLSDFTLDDFRMDLIRYLEANRAALEEAPMGLYACVPTTIQGTLDRPDSGIVAPGVIFCLRQKNIADAARSGTINPLTPYFLIYIRDDGVVRYNFAEVKQTLGLFRALCLGVPGAYETLCNAFDAETNDGRDMKKYSDLLLKAVEAIKGSVQKREIASLFGGRDAKIGKASERIASADDFDLVTWLVIR
jgi:superfamily II DNA or RNA helicase